MSITLDEMRKFVFWQNVKAKTADSIPHILLRTLPRRCVLGSGGRGGSKYRWPVPAPEPLGADAPFGGSPAALVALGPILAEAVACRQYETGADVLPAADVALLWSKLAQLGAEPAKEGVEDAASASDRRGASVAVVDVLLEVHLKVLWRTAARVQGRLEAGGRSCRGVAAHVPIQQRMPHAVDQVGALDRRLRVSVDAATAGRRAGRETAQLAVVQGPTGGEAGPRV